MKKTIFFVLLFIFMCVSYSPKKSQAHSDYSDVNPCLLGCAMCAGIVMENMERGDSDLGEGK